MDCWHFLKEIVLDYFIIIIIIGDDGDVKEVSSISF